MYGNGSFIHKDMHMIALPSQYNYDAKKWFVELQLDEIGGIPLFLRTRLFIVSHIAALFFQTDFLVGGC